MDGVFRLMAMASGGQFCSIPKEVQREKKIAQKAKSHALCAICYVLCCFISSQTVLGSSLELS